MNECGRGRRREAYSSCWEEDGKLEKNRVECVENIPTLQNFHGLVNDENEIDLLKSGSLTIINLSSRIGKWNLKLRIRCMHGKPGLEIYSLRFDDIVKGNEFVRLNQTHCLTLIPPDSAVL